MKDFSLLSFGDDNPLIQQHQAIVSAKAVPPFPIFMDLGYSNIMCFWEALLYHINFSYCRSSQPAARIWYGDILDILLLPANVAINAVDSIIPLLLLDFCISDWDSFAGNTLKRACTIAFGWWETVSLPGTVLDGKSISQGLFLQLKQPLGQQIAFSMELWQCFSRSRKPIPSLL